MALKGAPLPDAEPFKEEEKGKLQSCDFQLGLKRGQWQCFQFLLCQCGCFWEKLDTGEEEEEDRAPCRQSTLGTATAQSLQELEEVGAAVKPCACAVRGRQTRAGWVSVALG